MTLLALGLNHQSAPIALREQIALAPERTAAALRELRAEPGVCEAAVISTCNRTELYCRVAAGAEATPGLWLHRHFQLAPGRLEGFLYQHEGEAAVRHLFRVATGLDSMVLGEPQILGQVKTAYHLARDAGSLDSAMERLFQQSFSVAKRARTETRIGASPVSVAFAAVRLAQQIFADFAGAGVLLIGAGDTIELCARHLHEAGAKRIVVANRTLANARGLAERFHGQSIALADLPDALVQADIVIASTAAREPVISKTMAATALKARRHRPQFMLDLAVPRDIAADVADLEDVYLYTVDDIGRSIDEALRSRREAANEAEEIVTLAAEHFMAWLRAVDGQGPIQKLRAEAERNRDELLERARQMLQNGRDPTEALGFLANTLTNKLLHAPSSNLRAAALRGDSDLLRAAEQLFSADERKR
ncbi:MAG: glutamyl-tRNA reductase [Xanthomonadales bacterium]|nr:glutamyl-tRNA reductase [Xanthomonadales bacterium]